MGSDTENWFPYVKERLDDDNNQVIILQYPIDRDKHFYDYWKPVLDEYKNYINNNTVMIGHSSGCAFTIKYLIDNNLKIDSTDTNSNSISNITTTNTTVNNISNNSNLQQKQASSRFVSIDALDTQEAKAQNSKFDSYFGTDVTPYEVKDLLSEIRTNNLNAIRNKNAAIIGVCFISRNGTTNPTYGIYSMNNSNDYRDSSAFFDNLYFSYFYHQTYYCLNNFYRNHYYIFSYNQYNYY